MIRSKSELKSILFQEGCKYISANLKNRIIRKFTSEISYEIFRFQSSLRRAEYHSNKNSIYHKVAYILSRRKYNRLGRRLNIEIYDGCFKPGLKIYHSSGIVVHGKAIIGSGCNLHGNNCIGNNGIDDKVPVLGDNVTLGVGAKIIGNVTIANNTTIGANSVVIRSILEEGTIVAGAPARKIG
ncbi:serine O-acetyltransferase [Vibrio methylphosphonaticus]|uniref:serine O-acetyltransferase n=1 Tax=Vibrio methylphosphonaticus TaxID=2946866 RepID=UPI002029E944|nr:poly-gamma-glutamate biosynthesis protein [Vibrio methylphosphonaticus]MCL9775462.1 poly-gamma-glutamate biosynthesis protein [Vibrio methylphosphonaticus]